MPYHGINPHLEPFLPYVEKAAATPLREEWHPPNRLSRPIDIGVIKSWLKTCEAHHGDHCRWHDASHPEQHPAWLVDVHRGCIVPGSPNCVYATLSYVWGKAECFALTSATLDELLREGSLNHARLPRTIRDAMNLVATLGLGHLWVDRLCIIQDSDTEKHAQIKAMGAIYSRSHFTIVAAQSHDASGPLSSRPLKTTGSAWPTALLKAMGIKTQFWAKFFTGSRGSTFIDPASPWAAPQTDRDIISIMSADLIRTVWFSRGWTFQEFLFSRRKMVFHNNTVNWECHCSAFHEEQMALSKQPCLRPPVHANSLGVEIDTWPNFHRYARLASLLTPRHFTFPEDVLDAFAGASAAFARVYDGGLVTGIPEMVFDAALIWQPYHPLERRKAVAADEAVLPSWSWVSWRGEVQSESWQSGHDYLRLQFGEDEAGSAPSGPLWLTFPTVKWYHSATLTSARFLINSQAPKWRGRYLNTMSRDAPSGWQRHHEGPVYFTHEAISAQQFWYPVPIGLGHGRAARSRYLHCKTRRARVKFIPDIHRSYGTGCAVAGLQDPEGNHIGCIRLNDLLQDARGGRPTEYWDLIELSAGSVRLEEGDILDHPLADVFDEWSLPSWSTGKHQGVFEFINVMHIEWVSPGVASRVAVGRVEKRAWDGLSTETIEVAIG
ncbi:hypothetical protein OQA88_7422 [Cercophora sp. LCS_1]